MNSTKIKLIYYYLQNKNNKNRGFIDIYLLLVFLLIGFIGAAIMLPSFLNQTCGCRGTIEVQQNISSINKAQAAYRTENITFATDLDSLALGNLSGGNIDFRSSKYYTYIIKATTDYALVQAIPKAIPDDSSANEYKSGGDLKVSVGGVFKYINSDNLAVTVEIICQADSPTKIINPSDILLENQEIGEITDFDGILLKPGKKEFQCPEGSERL